MQLLFDKRKAETEYLKRWVESRVDAIIMPVGPWIGVSFFFFFFFSH